MFGAGTIVLKSLRLLGFVLALSLPLATAAKADFADSLFSRLKSYSVAGIDPDQIEMARFTIAHPSDASTVYARAAAQDYPFFALVGAAKAARGRSFPKIGTFDENTCKFPITAIDVVFGKASSTIDDTNGKAKTNSAMSVASGIAAQYAKAATSDLKQKLVDELNEEVPYFKDIGTICTFAFETDFKIDRNIQAVAGDVSREIVGTYKDFKGGHLVDGVGDLLTLGVSKDIACDLVDAAATEGLIGDVPGLNKLAGGVCKGFVGKVIDGVEGVAKTSAKAIAKGAKAVYCAVDSILGDGCSDAPPPPTGVTMAAAWCVPYGGAKYIQSKTNAPNDYSVVCNDGSACRVRPDRKPQCVTAAEAAKAKANQRLKNFFDFVTEPPKWAAEFDHKWTDQCLDEQCRTGLRVVRTGSLLALQQKHDADPDYRYGLTGDIRLNADAEANVLVAESVKRSNAFNAKATSSAAQGWEQIVASVWTKQCSDPACNIYVSLLALQMKQAAIDRQKAEPDESSLHIQGEINKEYGPKFQKEIDHSKVRVDPNASADAKLPALGCSNFLGRAHEYECPAQATYNICLGYLGKGAVKGCTWENHPGTYKKN